MTETVEQSNNSPHDALEKEKEKLKEASWLRPWQFKPGQSGNPLGRPKGSVSLKEYARQMLSSMTDEERQEFMKGLPKDTIWKMAEGNPDMKTDITTQGEKITTSFSTEVLAEADRLLKEKKLNPNANATGN